MKLDNNNNNNNVTYLYSAKCQWPLSASKINGYENCSNEYRISERDQAIDNGRIIPEVILKMIDGW